MNKHRIVALVAAGMFATVTASACTSPEAGSAAAAGPVQAVAAVAQVAPVDLSSARLTFAQKGAAVTVSEKGAAVATLTLDSARYTASSGHAVFSVDAAVPVVLDQAMFVLYDNDGGENTADQSATVTLPAGRNSVVLDFSHTHARPEAIGWVPVDGDSGMGLWAR